MIAAEGTPRPNATGAPRKRNFTPRFLTRSRDTSMDSNIHSPANLRPWGLVPGQIDWETVFRVSRGSPTAQYARPATLPAMSKDVKEDRSATRHERAKADDCVCQTQKAWQPKAGSMGSSRVHSAG